MIDEVIIARLGIGWRGEVDAVDLASPLDILVCASQPDQRRMEVLAVCLDRLYCISDWIAGNKHRQDRVFSVRSLNSIDDVGHLVELFRTDVWTIRKSELYVAWSIRRHLLSRVRADLRRPS